MNLIFLVMILFLTQIESMEMESTIPGNSTTESSLEKKADHRISFKRVEPELKSMQQGLDMLSAFSFAFQSRNMWQQSEEKIKECRNRLIKLTTDYRYFISESISPNNMATYFKSNEDVCYVTPLEDEQFEANGKDIYCFSLDQETSLVIKKDIVDRVKKQLEKTHKFIMSSMESDSSDLDSTEQLEKKDTKPISTKIRFQRVSLSIGLDQFPNSCRKIMAKIKDDYIHSRSQSITPEVMATYFKPNEDVCYSSPFDDEEFVQKGKDIYCYSWRSLTNLVIRKGSFARIERELENTHYFFDEMGKGPFWRIALK